MTIPCVVPDGPLGVPPFEKPSIAKVRFYLFQLMLDAIECIDFTDCLTVTSTSCKNLMLLYFALSDPSWSNYAKIGYLSTIHT